VDDFCRPRSISLADNDDSAGAIALSKLADQKLTAVIVSTSNDENSKYRLEYECFHISISIQITTGDDRETDVRIFIKQLARAALFRALCYYKDKQRCYL
jgi:hypothetical protein